MGHYVQIAALTLLVLGSLPAPAAAQMPVFPDFCLAPTKTAVASGNWSNAATWSPLGVPTTGDVVVIPSGRTVVYDWVSAAILDALCMESGGHLTFRTVGTTKLTVEELVVKHGGALTIGTAAVPIAVGTIAEVVFDCFNTCLSPGTPASPGIDPEQFGLGFLGEGVIRIHGTPKTSFVRTAGTLTAGLSTIPLATLPSNWAAGDAVVIPESRARTLAGTAAFQQSACAGQYCTYDDRRVLASAVTGLSAALTAGLTNAHPGGKNAAGVVEYRPHIANLTRNVIFRSANPLGTRGHTLFTHHADVDIRYALFLDGGRTLDTALHCTLFTSGAQQEAADCSPGTGALTQVGTNQRGRYAVHFHHLWGPPNPSNVGYQGTFLGNAVVDSTKWPVSIHWTSYLRFEDNVIAYGRSAGVMFEEYNEHYNEVIGNLVTGMRGQTTPRDTTILVTPGNQAAREASGFWSRSFNNTFRGNVAAGLWNDAQEIVTDVGFKFATRPAGFQTRVPNFRGADLTVAGQYTLQDAQKLPFIEFADNEAYGMGAGLTIWQHGTDGYVLKAGQPVSTIQDFTAWHVYEYGVFAYPIYNYVFDGLTVLGDPAQIHHSSIFSFPTGWTSGDYKAHTVTIRNSSFQNVGIGIGGLFGVDGPLVLDTITTHASRAGITIDGFYTPGTAATPLTARTTTITAHTHTSIGAAVPALWMRFDAYAVCCGGRFYADTHPYTTTLINYQGTGLAYRTYFSQQATLPYAGGLAPCTDTTTHPTILGITCLVGGTPTPPAPGPPSGMTNVRIRFR